MTGTCSGLSDIAEHLFGLSITTKPHSNFSNRTEPYSGISDKQGAKTWLQSIHQYPILLFLSIVCNSHKMTVLDTKNLFQTQRLFKKRKPMEDMFP